MTTGMQSPAGGHQKPCLLQLLKRQPFPQFYPNIYQKTWITSIFLGRFCELGVVKRLWSQHETRSHLGTLPSHDSFFWHPFLADHWVILGYQFFFSRESCRFAKCAVLNRWTMNPTNQNLDIQRTIIGNKCILKLSPLGHATDQTISCRPISFRQEQ